MFGVPPHLFDALRRSWLDDHGIERGFSSY
jgi:hypothetical protein